jgi:hypothetical protein
MLARVGPVKSLQKNQVMDVGINSSRVVQDEVLMIDTGGSSLSCVEVLIQILCKMCSCST